MSIKFDCLEDKEKKFAEKYILGDSALQYAIHGGGVPIRVKGVEGMVAVCVVSGLQQHEDHGVVIEQIEALMQGIKEEPMDD